MSPRPLWRGRTKVKPISVEEIEIVATSGTVGGAMKTLDLHQDGFHRRRFILWGFICSLHNTLVTVSSTVVESLNSSRGLSVSALFRRTTFSAADTVSQSHSKCWSSSFCCWFSAACCCLARGGRKISRRGRAVFHFLATYPLWTDTTPNFPSNPCGSSPSFMDQSPDSTWDPGTLQTRLNS